MRSLLLIEDSPEMQIIVKSAFTSDYNVVTASTASSAWQQLEKKQFDLILLDVVLPDGDGFKFCAMLKTSSQVPVVFLSGRTEVSDKVLGLAVGASDYITKPFSPLELRARVDAHLRDATLKKSSEDFFRVNDLCFNIPRQTITIMAEDSESELILTPIEFKLILFLARHQDEVMTRGQILDSIWGDRIYVVDRTVDVHISNLRKKLSSSQSSITPVLGVGYRFCRKNSDIKKT